MVLKKIKINVDKKEFEIFTSWSLDLCLRPFVPRPEQGFDLNYFLTHFIISLFFLFVSPCFIRGDIWHEILSIRFSTNILPNNLFHLRSLMFILKQLLLKNLNFLKYKFGPNLYLLLILIQSYFFIINELFYFFLFILKENKIYYHNWLYLSYKELQLKQILLKLNFVLNRG